jgi:hypothetical protein
MHLGQLVEKEVMSVLDGPHALGAAAAVAANPPHISWTT